MVLGPAVLLSIFAGYFVVLMVIARLTGRHAGNTEFFIAGRKSPWFAVAFGMVGASISGVTFLSVPGVVGAGGTNQAFSYLQFVLGYIIGYAIIANVLMPLYYRMNLISIYGYLEERFGRTSYRTGALFFMLSRTIGSAFRLFLVVAIMQQFVLAPLGMPFWATGLLSVALILIYTFRGGIKTIVWTDTLQTVCMLSVIVLTVYSISNSLGLSFGEILPAVQELGLNQVFFFSGGWEDPNNFFKQIISGALITIVMTGLDQDMMQKNLTCKNITDARKNMFVFTIILVLANVLFLMLGALLYVYVAQHGIEVPARTDQLFPTIALFHLSPVVAFLFVLGLTAMVYSSVDSTLAALTTAFCVDILDFKKKEKTESPEKLLKTRRVIHVLFALLFFIVILIFNSLNNDAVINQLFAAAGFTYGPLLGLFTFGLTTKRLIIDKWAPVVCILSPVISYLLNTYDDVLLGGFKLGFLILAVNGFLTYGGLWLISKPAEDRAGVPL